MTYNTKREQTRRLRPTRRQRQAAIEAAKRKPVRGPNGRFLPRKKVAA